MSADTLARLCAHFERACGTTPHAAVRAPGRINLIGEHTDYNVLPVLPMAIQRGIHVVFRPRDDGVVRLCDADPVYAAREFTLADEIAPFAQGDWGNYAKAAAQSLVRRSRIGRGIDAVVDGDIPREAGLSSSSALVVACTIALAAANGLEIPRDELIELCARAERYVGTQSGAMDQAICIGARVGHASLIEFEPLRFEPVPVPDDWRFVIANSLVRAPKAGAARESYNARTRECREALRLLYRGPHGSDLPQGYRALVRDVPEPELLATARAALPALLFRRFRHVVTEGRRVGTAREAMLAGDAATFGRAMNASHASLRDDYEVSCPELDELVGLMLEHGMAGARLTGAGFGGCTVGLCRAADVERLVCALEDGYYRPRGIDPIVAGAALLVAVPSDGARIVAL